MNIDENYNKTNIHYQICIEKADFLVRFLLFLYPDLVSRIIN